MKFEIWMQCKHPNWLSWQKYETIFLKDAIYLSMDVCPIWYEDTIISTVEGYYDQSEYRRLDADDKYFDNKEVFEAIEDEFNQRLKIARSWVIDQIWVVGSKPNIPDDIKLTTYVDLRKFLECAFTIMGYENDHDNIPLAIRGIIPSTEPLMLSSSDWKNKAKIYASTLLEQKQNTNQDAIVKQIFEYFKKERIYSSHAGGKVIALASIKDALSEGGWFSGERNKLKNIK